MCKVLRVIDLYCDSQQEFDKWIEVINESIKSYKIMIGEKEEDKNVQHEIWGT